jgi:hypothetical protein
MYWRVRQLSISELLTRYWVALALMASLFFNFVLVVSRPDPNKGLPKEVKANYELFGRLVTTHMLDTSYITYKQSTAFLLSGELNKNVIDWMKKNDLLAKGPDEVEQMAKTLYDQRQVSSVRIDTVQVNEPGKNQPVSVDVTGVVAIHSAQDGGPTNPVPFHFLFYMDLRHRADGTLILTEDNKQIPEVVDFKEIPQG